MLLLKAFNLTLGYDLGTWRIWPINPFTRSLSKLYHVAGGTSNYHHRTNPAPLLFVCLPVLANLRMILMFFNA